MRLGELISFVRGIPRTSDDQVDAHGLGDQPSLNEPNAARIERLPVPPWIGLDRGDLATGDEVADLVTVLEGDFDEGGLPADLRDPNVPIDALAYYLPFHLHNGRWGIYVRESGLLLAATILKGGALTATDSALIERARELLTKHEVLHFQAEVACARAEVVAGRRVYDRYFHNAFAAAQEEALGNAAAFRILRQEPSDVRARAAAWMKRQGPGYRDFERWTGPGKFAGGCRRTSQHILSQLGRRGRNEPAEFLFDSMTRFKPPIYLVRDLGRAETLRPFPKAHGMRVLVHTNDHPSARTHRGPARSPLHQI